MEAASICSISYDPLPGDSSAPQQETCLIADFSGPAPVVEIVNSTCGNGQTMATGGELRRPKTSCPQLTTLEYSMDGFLWTTVLPTYDPLEPMTIETRCNCANTIITSPTGVTTEPGVCIPVFDPCESAVITTDENAIVLAGLGGNVQVRIFDDRWKSIYHCQTPKCSPTNERVITGKGVFHVYVDFFDAAYQSICQIRKKITVESGDPCINAGGDQDHDGICDDNDPCIGTNCGSAITKEKCGIQLTLDGVKFTMVGTEKSTISIRDRSNWNSVFFCASSRSQSCGNQISITLEPNKEYSLVVYNGANQCWIKGNISTPENFTNDASLSRSRSNNEITSLEATMDLTSEIKSAVSTYPNPTSQQFFVSLDGYIGQKGRLNLINSIGQHVRSVSVDQLKADPVLMDVSSLEVGLYYLQIFIDETPIESAKLIVK